VKRPSLPTGYLYNAGDYTSSNQECFENFILPNDSGNPAFSLRSSLIIHQFQPLASGYLFYAWKW